MEIDDRTMLEQIRLLGLQFPEEKKEAVFLMIRVYMEVLKRCPYLAKMPMEEQKELLRILKECNVI